MIHLVPRNETQSGESSPSPLDEISTDRLKEGAMTRHGFSWTLARTLACF